MNERPIFGAASAVPIAHGVAMAAELEAVDLRLQCVVPPDQLDAARAEVRRRNQEMGITIFEAYRRLCVDVVADRWPA